MRIAKPPKHETRRWDNEIKEDDHWHLYALIFGCVGVMTLVLIYKKLSGQKGTWNKHLTLKNIYLYNDQHPENTLESKGEFECRKYLETVFGLPFPKTRPDFLRNPVTGNNLEIDCFNQTLALGVEYNGKQHYSYSPFFHRNKDASTNQQYRDELKRRMCQENNITLIEVPYTIKPNDIGAFLHFKLKSLGYLV